MTSLKKRIGSALLIALVLVTLLAATALAGSPKEEFSLGVNDEGIFDRSEAAQKTDAGTTSGNHATVVATSVAIPQYGGTPHLRVVTANDVVVTGNHPFTEPKTVNIPYEKAVTNGELYLECYAVGGAAGISGYWYP